MNALDLTLANSHSIIKYLSDEIREIRLARNLPQTRLAKEAGLSLETLRRFERGEGISLDSFIRILIALKLQSNLAVLLPNEKVRPVDRLKNIPKKAARRRASGDKMKPAEKQWRWGDAD